MLPEELAAARKRAYDWKKKPLASNKAQIMVKGRRAWRKVYRVKYVDPAMRQWITQDEINAATEKMMALNPR